MPVQRNQPHDTFVGTETFRVDFGDLTGAPVGNQQQFLGMFRAQKVEIVELGIRSSLIGGGSSPTITPSIKEVNDQPNPDALAKGSIIATGHAASSSMIVSKRFKDNEASFDGTDSSGWTNQTEQETNDPGVYVALAARVDVAGSPTSVDDCEVFGRIRLYDSKDE